MKIYLHGGRNKETGRELFFKHLARIFEKENIQQVLHVPFAKIGVVEKFGSWKRGWFEEQFPGIEFLNARYKEDIEKVDLEQVFVLITGGSGNVHLYEIIVNHPPLLKIVKNAPYILGSSAGMMVLGNQFRIKDDFFEHHRGLGIVDYIGEPHCAARDRNKYLQQYIDTFDIETAIGVDEDTILEWEGGKFGKTRGEGKSYIVKRSNPFSPKIDLNQ